MVIIILPALILYSCRQDEVLVPDNNPPGSNGVSTIIIENFVNKCFIDLLGREPLDEELRNETLAIKNGGLEDSVKLKLILKLQFDSTWIEGDSSYLIAYHKRLYDLGKVRMIEGSSNVELNKSINIFAFNLHADSLIGDSAGVAKWRDEVHELKRVLKIQYQFRKGKISINEVFRRYIDNAHYDDINMNTFNFINATFDNLLYRFPTDSEFDKAWDMITNSSSEIILGMNGASRGDYMDILTGVNEFYEGLIRWQYETLLGREAMPVESFEGLNLLLGGASLQDLQQHIMTSEEYANF